MTSEEQLSVGTLAHRGGTTVRTVRHYEHIGLLEPATRTAGGHRRYDHTHVRRLLHVLALRDLGVPLEHIRPIADGEDTRALLELLLRHRGEIEAQRALLTTTLTRIDELATRARTPAGSGATEPAPRTTQGAALDLLEGLAMSVALTRIYTRSGDDGTTGLGSDGRIPKTDIRIEVLGAVDELTAALGIVIAEPGADAATEVLWRIQNELFDLGADVAVPVAADRYHDLLAEDRHGKTACASAADGTAVRITEQYVTRLERDCDRVNADLPPLRSFVLPGTSSDSARLHVARAVCRRAERHAWQLEDVNPHVCRYLNRLSDLLFILARACTAPTGALWSPRGGVHPETGPAGATDKAATV